MGNIFVRCYLIFSCMGSCRCFIVTGIFRIRITLSFSNKVPRITTIDDPSVIIYVWISKVGKGNISLRFSGDWKVGYKRLSTIGGIYFILKPFGGGNTLGFSSTDMRGEQNCGWIGRNRRRGHRCGIWGILKYRSIRSGNRDWSSYSLERLLQTKGRLGGLIRGINVVLTLNKPTFFLPFSGSEPFIVKCRTVPSLQTVLDE